MGAASSRCGMIGMDSVMQRMRKRKDSTKETTRTRRTDMIKRSWFSPHRPSLTGWKSWMTTSAIWTGYWFLQIYLRRKQRLNESESAVTVTSFEGRLSRKEYRTQDCCIYFRTSIKHSLLTN